LDRRRATTHWNCAEDFRRLYPQVLLDENVLFVDDGDVLTSAGLAAGADLCLHVLRRDHGAETGLAPGARLIQQRVRHAQWLLETTDLPVDRVVTQAGLGTGATLRQHLRSVAGVAPAANRRTFRGSGRRAVRLSDGRGPFPDRRVGLQGWATCRSTCRSLHRPTGRSLCAMP